MRLMIHHDSTCRVARSDGGGYVLEPGSQANAQLHPPQRRMSDGVELRFQHNATLPVHSLPAELFHQIIHYLVQPFFHKNKADYYRHILRLAGVCSHWRGVIRDLPPLWTEVHSSDPIDVVGMALQRSSSHLLDITIDHLPYPNQGPRDMQEFLNAIIPHRHRWKTVDASASFLWIPLITTAFQEPALSLERLSLTDEDGISSTREVDLFGGSAPQLKDLTLSGISTPWESEVTHDLRFIDLSWIHFPSPKTVLDILSYSPQLHRAIIWRCTTEETFTDSLDPIRLSQLSFLRIDFDRPEAVDNVLDSVKVSQRSCLAIRSPTGEDVDAFLRRRVAKWTSNWDLTATSQFDGLLLDIDKDELRIGIFTTDDQEPLTLTIEGFRTLGTDFLLALSCVVDTLTAWSKESVTLHLKLGVPPSAYYAARIKRLFVNELSRLLSITSVELSSVDDYSLVDILIYEGAWSVFQNISTLSFSGMTPSDLSTKLEWVSHATRFIKVATESSIHEVDHTPKLQKVELRVSFTAGSGEIGIVDVVVKELEGIVGPGRVLVVNANQNYLI